MLNCIIHSRPHILFTWIGQNAAEAERARSKLHCSLEDSSYIALLQEGRDSHHCILRFGIGNTFLTQCVAYVLRRICWPQARARIVFCVNFGASMVIEAKCSA